MTTTRPADHSRFVTRVRRRLENFLPLLEPGLPDQATMQRLLGALGERNLSLETSLRHLRNLVIERLAVLDVEESASVSSITQAMTTLAEVCLQAALAQALKDARDRHGTARNAQGEPIEFWILGMGKLGAHELNVSSDVDLVYVFDDDGGDEAAMMTDAATPSSRSVSVHEHFAFVAKRLQALIGDVTEDGFVFRVDLALRPNGNSGPVVVSLSMLETYFVVQGREWERFAWLKSRIVAPAEAGTSDRAKALQTLATHFVYRRHLDYGVFESLRVLHRKVRDDAERRAAGRPERANDVKLARGGIREIEFIVQLLQVVRGGQFPELRTRGTLSALERLSAMGLMSAQTATALAQAYEFLRQVEHRIQYLDDEQTHLMPTQEADLTWIAQSLRLADARALHQRLHETREVVAAEFDALLHDGHADQPTGGAMSRSSEDKGSFPSAPLLSLEDEALVDGMPQALRSRWLTWLQQSRVQSLRDESKQRLARLVQRVGQAVTSGAASEQGALRFIDWVEPLLRRDSYVALLIERPSVLQRLLRLLGLARWSARYLMRHPAVIDELADDRLLLGRFDRAAYTAELEARHAAWEQAGDAVEETLLDSLRLSHHAEVFRTLVRDVEGRLTVEQVADDLSALADATLQACLKWSWPLVKHRHRETPQLAIIAYGKLGGKELGYGSDLDIVFLYDDDHERASEVYASFVRKLITWLTLRTGAGELFDIDTALRPNGNSGLLVTSIDSFESYQSGRGSNTAWTWEHQAITRARWCAGDERMVQRFEAVRRGVLCAPRDAQSLASEVRAMRERVRAAKPSTAGGPEGGFDVKHSPGGMMDAEFAVQYLVLSHAGQHEALIGNVGNIALLQRAESAGLLPPGVGQAAAAAYRELRRMQHQARLDEQPTSFDLASHPSLAASRDAVLRLWSHVFGAASGAESSR